MDAGGLLARARALQTHVSPALEESFLGRALEEGERDALYTALKSATYDDRRVYDPRSRKIVYLRPCSPADATLIRARLSCDPDAILGQVDGARADDDDDAHDDAHDDHDDPRSIAPNTSTKRAAQPTEYESPRRPRLRL